MAQALRACILLAVVGACKGVCDADDDDVCSCTAGRYYRSTGGCTTCPAGRFSTASSCCTTSQCMGPCNAGRYGLSGASSSSCTGPCSAGFFCVAGSTSAQPASGQCPTGRYSLEGAASCTLCFAGRFGASVGLTTNMCSGVCAAGRYSLPGAAACTDCPEGVYGATPATTPACTGLCRAGYACGAGSTNATARICLPGTYSVGGQSECTPCAAGRFGNSSGLSMRMGHLARCGSTLTVLLAPLLMWRARCRGQAYCSRRKRRLNAAAP
jgi:hypothetical protein